MQIPGWSKQPSDQLSHVPDCQGYEAKACEGHRIVQDGVCAVVCRVILNATDVLNTPLVAPTLPGVVETYGYFNRLLNNARVYNDILAGTKRRLSRVEPGDPKRPDSVNYGCLEREILRFDGCLARLNGIPEAETIDDIIMIMETLKAEYKEYERYWTRKTSSTIIGDNSD